MIPDPPPGGAMSFGDHKMMLMMDPPQHTAFRRLISREFTQAPAAGCARESKRWRARSSMP